MTSLHSDPEPVYTGMTIEYLPILADGDDEAYVAGIAQADLLGEDGDYLGYSEWSQAVDAIAAADDLRAEREAELSGFHASTW